MLFQAGTCYVNDRVSANGTWLNGRLVAPGSTHPLENYATIKTGSTVWTFIEVRPASAAAAPAPADTQADAEVAAERIEAAIDAEAVEAERDSLREREDERERDRERERAADPDSGFGAEPQGRKRPPTVIN